MSTVSPPGKSERVGPAVAARRPVRRLSQQFAVVCRWLHIYLSMFGFATIVFFSVTGITLNHPDWFGLATDRSHDFSGRIPEKLLTTSDTATAEGVDRLGLAEFLRHEHRIKGSVTDFRSDDLECTIIWKGPGYSADAIIDRETSSYEISIVEHGVIPLINDLHKGRDTGPDWSLVIDLSAALMTISAITGVVLLLYIRRKLVSGLVTGVVGLAAMLAAIFWLVP